MSEHVHYLKPPKVARSKGRARPDEPLADYCEIGVWAVCSEVPAVRHHRKLRKQGGSDAAVNTLDACDPCHRYVHAHPAESYGRGWLLHEWDEEGRAPTHRLAAEPTGQRVAVCGAVEHSSAGERLNFTVAASDVECDRCRCVCRGTGRYHPDPEQQGPLLPCPRHAEAS